jgi:hypothetical protein
VFGEKFMKKLSWILLGVGLSLLLIFGIAYKNTHNTKTDKGYFVVKTSLLGEKIYNLYTELQNKHIVIRDTMDITNNINSIFPPGMRTSQAIQILRDAGLNVYTIHPNNLSNGAPLSPIQSKELVIGRAIVYMDYYHKIRVAITLYPSTINMPEGVISNCEAIFIATYL